eukprot:2156175-Lingulodinium_polyedra.AAC.1
MASPATDSTAGRPSRANAKLAPGPPVHELLGEPVRGRRRAGCGCFPSLLHCDGPGRDGGHPAGRTLHRL